MCEFKKWYYECDEKNKDTAHLMGSTVEVFLFYLNIIALIIFSNIIWFANVFLFKYLIFLIPTLLWVFLRSSRKDMTATANWIAAIFGAISGAALVIASKMIIK